MKNKKSKIKNLKLKMLFLLFIIGVTVFSSYSYSGQWEIFTNKNDVRDIALSSNGKTLWAATTGGVVAWNLDNYSYKSYTTADGLLSCDINKVAIDNKGRPWVATKDPGGLFLYENNEWKQINVGSVGNDIVRKHISGLEVDQFGNVWVFFYGYFFLWRYDGQTWHKHESVHGPLGLDLQKNLLSFDRSRGSDHRLRFKIVSFNGSEFVNKLRFQLKAENSAFAHIAQDSKGNLWFSYFGDRYGETYGVVCNNTLYNTLDGLADDMVWNITTDESGNVWCATNGGISKFTGNRWITYDTSNGVASNRIYRILIDNNNTNTLYAVTSKGISIMKNNQWKTLKTINEPSLNKYSDMAIDKRGSIILSGNDHIAIYNDSQWKMNFFRNIRVRDFIKSKDGTLYAIGNENNGNGNFIKGCILKQKTGRSTFLKVLSCKYSYSFSTPAVAGSGNDPCIWLSNGNNLVLLNKQTATIFLPSRFGIEKDSRITCMLPDRDGRSVWVGYHSYKNSNVIVHFDGDTVINRINLNDGFTTGPITAIVRDSSGNLWFASDGITVLRNMKLTKYFTDSDDKPFGGCNALFVDRSGVVWTHTDNGIARFNGSSWKLYDSTVVSPLLPYSRSSHIVQDKSGTVWFGTGCGLLAYKDSKWYQFTTRDGIPHNCIRDLVVNSKDNLWILTDYGIAMRKAGGMTQNPPRYDVVNPGYKPKIIQRGNRFYINSKAKVNKMQYTLFDLRGRAILKQTIHQRKSFVIPENKYRISSGLRILSITIEHTNGKQNRRFPILDF